MVKPVPVPPPLAPAVTTAAGLSPANVNPKGYVRDPLAPPPPKVDFIKPGSAPVQPRYDFPQHLKSLQAHMIDTAPSYDPKTTVPYIVRLPKGGPGDHVILVPKDKTVAFNRWLNKARITNPFYKGSAAFPTNYVAWKDYDGRDRVYLNDPRVKFVNPDYYRGSFDDPDFRFGYLGSQPGAPSSIRGWTRQQVKYSKDSGMKPSWNWVPPAGVDLAPESLSPLKGPTTKTTRAGMSGKDGGVVPFIKTALRKLNDVATNVIGLPDFSSTGYQVFRMNYLRENPHASDLEVEDHFTHYDSLPSSARSSLPFDYEHDIILSPEEAGEYDLVYTPDGVPRDDADYARRRNSVSSSGLRRRLDSFRSRFSNVSAKLRGGSGGYAKLKSYSGGRYAISFSHLKDEALLASLPTVILS